MTSSVVDRPIDTPAEPPRRRRRRIWLVLAIIAGVLVALVVAGVIWFFVGRDEATARSSDDVLEDFRLQEGGTAGAGTEGLPAVGVYAATATGDESVGIAGLDEGLGPDAPVTVTHGDEGCFTYRADLNTHHWRSWTYCATPTATFALTATESSTSRKFPGLDFGSLNTYTCDQPLPAIWVDQEVGQTGEGSCTGTSDTISGVTTDAGSVEVIEFTTVTVGGTDVPVVHIRTSDVFGEAQTGTEQADLWLSVDSGLPLRVSFDTRTKSDTPVGTADYVDQGQVDLTSLDPTT